MKTIFKAKYLLLVVTFILYSCGSNSNKQNSRSYYDELSLDYENSMVVETYTYNMNTALLIGMLYVLSCPSLETDEYDIYDMVSEYEHLLHENASVIKGMKRLGKLLVAQGTQNFNFTNAAENNTRENVIGMCNRDGYEGQAGEFADKVVSGMREEQLRPIVIGQELLWLADVIPDAANGDWEAYEDTGSWIRREAKTEIAIIEQQLKLIRSIDPQAAQLLEIVLPEMSKWSLEYGMGYIVATGIYLGVFK
jgi:hypothetical protein